VRRLLWLLFALLPFVSCREQYVAPCTISPDVVVAESSSLTSLVQNEGGTMIMTSYAPRPPDPDAGATPTTTVLPASADVVVLRADGSIAERHTFAAPDALAARRGNTGDAAATWSGDGVVFHWVDAAITQSPDGTTTTTTTLKTAFVGNDGRRGDVVIPASTTCTACRLSIAFASLGGNVIGVGRVTPDGSQPPSRATPARTFALRFARDGHLLGEEAPPWLGGVPESADAGIPSIVSSGAIAIEVHDGAFAVVSGTSLFIANADLALLAGPIRIPNVIQTELAWDPLAAEVTLASVGTASILSATDSRATSSPDVFVQRLGARGEAVTAAARVTTASQVIAVARSGDRIGVLVAESGEAIAVSDDHGKKLAGDQTLTAQQAPTTGDASAAPAAVGVLGGTHLLSAGDRRFVRWSSRGTRVIRTELVCDP
jgi:hypothetical protein